MEIQTVIQRVMSSDGKHSLWGKVYLPPKEPCGFFHVVHGMTEHIGRYDAFMRRMAEQGYICFGYDHLGHGRTATDKSEWGYFAHRDGWDLLAKDVQVFFDAVKAQYGDLPYVLMGHSMGSFIVRMAAFKYVKPQKLIVMGTGAANPAAGAGIALIRVLKCFCGEKHVSPLVDKMAFGSYNERFDENDPHAWLTKNQEIRDKYAADEQSGFRFTLSAMEDLIRLNRMANTDAWFKGIARDLPILLVSGADDPVGDYGKGVRDVYERLQAQGADVTMHLYEDCRHEILNDTCREEVIADILDFLK